MPLVSPPTLETFLNNFLSPFVTHLFAFFSRSLLCTLAKCFLWHEAELTTNYLQAKLFKIHQAPMLAYPEFIQQVLVRRSSTEEKWKGKEDLQGYAHCLLFIQEALSCSLGFLLQPWEFPFTIGVEQKMLIQHNHHCTNYLSHSLTEAVGRVTPRDFHRPCSERALSAHSNADSRFDPF